jgi:uncharacterized alkaline shock family protein YloU
MMNFFRRLSVVIYMLLMLGVGALLLLVSLNAVSPEQWAELLSTTSETASYRLTAGIIGGLFVIIGIIAPYRMEKRIKKNRTIAFQNPDGEVTVSLSAIEEYIRKIAKGISGIKDVSSRVDVSKRGIDIVTGVTISAAANIPEVTERIQREVKSKVQGMLGVEEKINMKMHVKRITRGAREGEGAVGEEMMGTEHIPFREM